MYTLHALVHKSAKFTQKSKNAVAKHAAGNTHITEMLSKIAFHTQSTYELAQAKMFPGVIQGSTARSLE